MTEGGNIVPHERGYTLIEMLVALAVTGLLAAMLLSGLSSANGFISRTAQRASGGDAVYEAQRMLRTRVEGLRPVIRLDSMEPTVDAQGDEASFSFQGPPPDAAQPDAPWRYRLQTTADGALMLYHASSLDRRYDFGAPGATGWQGQRVIDNVAAMRISYFGRDPISNGRRWQTRWFRRPQPPDLVRISVRFRDGDDRLWPDLVIRPRATINTACKIDALTGRCAFET